MASVGHVQAYTVALEYSSHSLSLSWNAFKDPPSIEVLAFLSFGIPINVRGRGYLITETLSSKCHFGATTSRYPTRMYTSEILAMPGLAKLSLRVPAKMKARHMK